METIDFIDAVTDMLETMKVQGVSAVPISEENRRFLRTIYKSGGPTTPKPSQPDPAPKRREPAPQAKPVAAPPFPAPQQPQAKPTAAPPFPAPQQPQAKPSAAPTFTPPQQPTPTLSKPQPAAFAPVANAPVATMDWATLEATAKGCRACQLCEGRKTVVVEDGCRTADLMFIGEGPGQDEDEQGVPFVGVAGQLLTKIISAMGFERKDVYITNIVKCHPPSNRNPKPEEAEACIGFLNRQIQLVQPKAIILLGAVPLQYLVNLRGITHHRGKWTQYQSIPVMPTFHPSFLLRKPEHKRDAWADVQEVMRRLGKQPPPARR